MAGESMKTYQVEYLITMKDNASGVLTTLAENATKLKEPLEQVKGYIREVEGTLRTLKENVNTALVIKPELNTAAIKEQLKGLETDANKIASNIARTMSAALSGVAPKSSAKKPTTKAEIKKEIAEAERLKVTTRGAAAKALGQEIGALKRKLASASDKTVSSDKVIQSYSTLAKETTKLSAAADAIKKINTNVSAMGSLKDRSIKIDADISPAVAKINALLETIRTNVAALPITVTEAGKAAAAGTKGGKAISSKTGKATKIGAANVKAASKGSLNTVQNVLRAKENITQLATRLDGSTLVTQLIQSIEKLQTEAKTKPVVIRSVFNGDDAGFQLNRTITSLQELANGKPIVLKSTLATGASPANTGTGKESAQTATGKDGKGSVQTGSKWTPATQSQINAYEKHLQQMSDMRINNAIESIRQKYASQALAHAEKQAMFEKLFGREDMHQRWLERDAAGQSTRAKNNAARQYRETLAERTPTLYNTRQKRLAASEYPVLPVMPGGGSSSGGAGGYGGAPMRMAKPSEGMYAKTKALMYNITGNTSFGARTPMAIEMAKGMGTMFAIGGAMSAIGSSLSQSVNYQNIMKTTQSILENGTSNYSDGGFKEMEQVVRQVGKETKFTAPQVASAAKFLAMAGYDIPSIKSAINPVANIALIGDTNLGETADKLTNVMTTFGIAPEKMNDIADIMTSTFTRSNTDMMMLAESAKYAGGIAHMYGGNFQNNFSDVMAMFGILGNAGIQASSAGTTLRMMYQNLMQPNKNQKKTLSHYGITTRDASGSPLEMAEIVKQIYEKVPKEQLADAVGNMFRITAQPGAAALVQAIGTGKLSELIDKNRGAAGTGVAQKIADEKKNTLSGLWAQVESTFTEGILQAVENRQGGWAGMLAQLRDFLAKPETIQILSSLVDLVEQLVKVIKEFAEIYANVYHAFPNLINFWMRFQLFITQIGFLVTPVIQLMGLFDTLKKVMYGVAAATTAATVAENGRRVATGGGAAATLLGGAVSGAVGRTAQARSSSLLKGLVAANIAGGFIPYKGLVPYNQVIGYAPRPDILGPLSLTRNQNRFSPQIAEQIKMYERSRGYMWRGMSKHQKRQLNRTIDNQIARLKASSVYVPSILPLSFGLGKKPIYRHGREITKGTYYRAGVSQVMPFHQYSARTGSMLAGAKAQADKAAIYRWRSQKWGSISANQALSVEQRAMAAARSEKYLNAAIEAEALRQEQMIAQQKASRARIAQIAAARHASRGPIDSAVRNRFIQRYGFNRVAKKTLSNSFSAGRAMGTLSFVSMFGGIKRGALSLLGGLAKAIGLLVSPVGLVTIAIGGLAAIAYKAYKDYKKYKANTKLANENQKRIIQQQKSVSDLYETTGYDVYGIKPLNINLSKPKPKRKDFPSAFSLAKNKIVSNLLNKDNTDKLVGSYIADKYISNFKYLPESYISNYYRDNKNYTYRKKWDRTTGEYVEERHESPAAKENAIKLGIVTQWAALATQQASVKEALAKVQTAIKNKNFNLAQKIVASYKPVSNWSMLTGNDAKAISQIQDPTKYYEWQYAQYKVLQDSLIAETQASKYSHALDLINNFKGSNKKDRENYDGTALAQLLIQSIPVVINGTKASLSLDKMGHIDWAALAQSVNNSIPFTIGQQADIMDNVYKVICNDPNIKNVSSVIELLQIYLPQIAHVSNPYDGVSWSNWGEDPEGDKQRREKNIEQVVSIPFAAPDITKPSWGLPNSMWDVRKPAVPLLTSDLDRTIAENGGSIVKGMIAYGQKYPDRFPQTSSSASSTTNTNKNNVSRYNPSDDKKQKDYASTYGRNAAKPTQVIINIDKLASFDRTAISKESNERAITEAIEIKIAEAVSMLSSQILTAASATISQGLS